MPGPCAAPPSSAGHRGPSLRALVRRGWRHGALQRHGRRMEEAGGAWCVWGVWDGGCLGGPRGILGTRLARLHQRPTTRVCPHAPTPYPPRPLATRPTPLTSGAAPLPPPLPRAKPCRVPGLSRPRPACHGWGLGVWWRGAWAGGGDAPVGPGRPCQVRGSVGAELGVAKPRRHGTRLTRPGPPRPLTRLARPATSNPCTRAHARPPTPLPRGRPCPYALPHPCPYPQH